VGAKNLEITQFISQTQLVVCLQLVTMAGSADTLKVLATVWIASLQSPDEPRRDDVVHMTAYSSLLEIYAAQLHPALSAECSRPTFPPSLPGWS
jgi:hypothetical protein